MKKWNEKNIWIAVISFMIIGTTGLHYSTHTHHTPLHALYRKLYYLPILLGAFRFGLKGAMLSAFCCGALYFPHLHFDWGADYFVKNTDRSLELILYFVIAAITGTYSSYQKKLILQLNESHQNLKKQTETLINAQNTLKKQEKLHAIGLLGAGISHEIRNPLASLKGILEIILSSKNIDPQKQELADIASKEISRIQKILNTFLSVSRDEKTDFSEQNLNEICNDLIKLLQNQLDKKNLNIDFNFSETKMLFNGPSNMIQQVLLNLLLNAMDEADHHIVVALNKENGLYKISVSDDGRGIEPSKEQVIFDYFYTSKQEGNGLGLAISSELMHQLGGTLILRNIKKPTTFEISFPSEFKFSDGGKHKVTL